MHRAREPPPHCPTSSSTPPRATEEVREGGREEGRAGRVSAVIAATEDAGTGNE